MEIKYFTYTTLFSFSLLAIVGCSRGSDAISADHLQAATVKPVPLIMSNNFTPEGDKTLLFIGQDSDTISDYINSVPEDNIEAVTLYTGLKNADPHKTLKGLFKNVNYGAGNNNFPLTLAESPDAALAIGLAFDNCNQDNHEGNIANGSYDQTIKYMIEHLKSLAPRKVFLRIGYEFDGPWNCYSPQNYIASFKKIAKAIKDQGASNITTVWQSAAWLDSWGNPLYDIRKDTHLDNWYPGDGVVDWVGMSVFFRTLSQWNYVPPITPEKSQKKILDFAKAHNKPVMIAESAPMGIRIGELTAGYIQINQPIAKTPDQIWQTWYQPYFDFIDTNKDVIRAVAYINTHWESQSMWQCQPDIPAGQPGCSQANWGDSRIQANEEIKARWLKQINNSERWIQTSQY